MFHHTLVQPDYVDDANMDVPMQPHSPGETIHQSLTPKKTTPKADQFKIARETTNETLQILSSIQPNQFKLYNDALQILNNQMLSNIPGKDVLSSLSQLENRERATTSHAPLAALPPETLDMQIIQAEMPQQHAATLGEIQVGRVQPNALYEPE